MQKAAWQIANIGKFYWYIAILTDVIARFHIICIPALPLMASKITCVHIPVLLQTGFLL